MRDPASQDPLPVSRRTVIGAAAASPLDLKAALEPGQVRALSEGWLARRAESDRLMLRWSRLEARLAADHGWYGLDETQRRALEAGRCLDEIDARLDVLWADQAQLLERLSASPSAHPRDVAAKLAVAVKLLPPDKHPAHQLIAGAWRELVAMLA